MGPETPYARAAGKRPAAITLAEAGALHVDPREFRLLIRRGGIEYPLTNAHFMVPQLPKRRIRDHGNVHVQWGIMIGANASGEFTNRLRKSSPKDVLGFLRARGQFGFPASMQTDTGLGFLGNGTPELGNCA